MSDKKETPEAPETPEAIYDQLNASGKIEEVIELFARTSDEEIPDVAKEAIRINVKNVAEKLDRMIIILKDIASDPTRKEAFQNELKKQLNVSFRKKKDDNR